MDERLKQLLKELGNAINESISSSDSVNERSQKIRNEGYSLYVVLDATIGLGKNDDESEELKTELKSHIGSISKSGDIQFRINVQDLAFLKSLGIDPTRKVRIQKRLEGRTLAADDEQVQS